MTDDDGELISNITLTRWVDHTIDTYGFDARSEYVEYFWLPVLGPTATCTLRAFSLILSDWNGSAPVDLVEIAQRMGLSYRAGQSSPFSKALQRLTMFGIAHHTADGIAVRTVVPPVSRRQIDKMPPAVSQHHDLIIARHNKKVLAEEESRRQHPSVPPSLGLIR